MRFKKLTIGLFAILLTICLCVPSWAVVTRLTYPKFQALDTATGTPLVGGQVWSYRAGTDTLSNTYSDAAGTVANTNPVILDSRGEADILIAVSTKVKLLNASGGLIWTVDNLFGPSTGTYLSGGTWAILQAAITAAGSTPTTFQLSPETWSITADLTFPSTISLKIDNGTTLSVSTTKTLTINGPFETGLYQVFSCAGTGKVVFGRAIVPKPIWWGLNGINDDVAVQAAINSLPVSGDYLSAGKIDLGNFNYKFASTVKSNDLSYLIITGDFPYITADSNIGALFQTGDYGISATRRWHIYLSNMILDGANLVGKGIYQYGLRNSGVSNCIVYRFIDKGVHIAQGDFGNEYNSLRMYYNHYPMVFDGDNNATKVNNCQAYFNSYGVDIDALAASYSLTFNGGDYAYNDGGPQLWARRSGLITFNGVYAEAPVGTYAIQIGDESVNCDQVIINRLYAARSNPASPPDYLINLRRYNKVSIADSQFNGAAVTAIRNVVAGAVSEATIHLKNNYPSGGTLIDSYDNVIIEENGVRTNCNRKTLTNNSATPSVAGSEYWIAENSNPTSITNLLNPLPNQEINLNFRNGNTTIIHGATISLQGGVNWNPGTGSFLTLKYDVSLGWWNEVSRRTP